MPRHLWKIIVPLLIILTTAWVHGWYLGKAAPSVADTAVVEETEAVDYFAGGCFWCVESDYEKLPGVIDAVSGYMGGDAPNPAYREVARGGSGHREIVKVTYDPSTVSYRRLVLDLLKHTDPTDAEGSFFDRGHQYTSAVYYQSEEEKIIAEDVIAEVDALGVFDAPIATSIEPASTFWIAEEYHQDYYTKNSVQYNFYRKGSGRDAFIESVWGNGTHDDLFISTHTSTSTMTHTKDTHTNSEDTSPSEKDWSTYQKPDDATLKETLTPLQYKVTQREGTERPFQNEYWDNHEDGIYVDIVSGEPLFSSTDKFDSGTGWPSFLKPLDPSFVTEHKDFKLIYPRTEIRSTYADSHLGHIILDGPIENDRIRYCMNSAALRFIPKEELGAEGLSAYTHLFSETEYL